MAKRIFSVFIAGAKNLQPLRLRLKALANDMNNEFNRNGNDLTVNMVSYENFGDEQSIYNKFITEEADMIIFLLEDRIGAKTEEEYKLTVERQKKNGHPEHCVFLKEFDERTDDIAHIEELMQNTSNKYYVNYRNPEDLIAKVKARVTSQALKAGKKGKSSAHRKKTPLWIPLLCAVMVLAVAFRCITGALKANYLFFEMPSFPTELEQNGINTKYVEQQLMLTLNVESARAQNKLNRILNDADEDYPGWKIDFPSKFQSGGINGLRSSLRKMLGCRDLKATLHLIDSDSKLTSELFVTDWDDRVYSSSAEMEVGTEGDPKTEFSKLIWKNAANLSLPYNPVVSVLYDYQFLNELQVYQMISPWTDEVFTQLEKENLLTEYSQKDGPNAPMATLLLGHYYESLGLENGFEKTSLRKAMEHYETLRDDPAIGDFIKEKIANLEGYTQANVPQELGMVEALERKGAFQTMDCEQLIIVCDEERLLVDSKPVYKATLYSFEKGSDGRWVEKYPSYKVNLGAKGLVSPEEKVEGDLKTPTGYYPIHFAFGKKKDLQTKLDFIEIGQRHVWVSDTASSLYNRIVVDEDGSFLKNKMNEKLYRTDELYDYAIVIDYNAEPAVKGKGGGVFIHIQRSENSPTAGCVSMSKDQVIELIEWLNKDKKPHIYISK